MAARTEVLLGGSPHDPGARCAGSSVSGYTHPSQHRGHLRGFGCVPGLPPGVAPDGDDARSRPPQPHRDDRSGSARGERRSRRRAAATPSPPAPTIRQSVKSRRTPTARSGAAWPQPRCSNKSPPACPPDHFLRITNSSGNARPDITATTGRWPAIRSWANSGGAAWAWSTRPSRSRWAAAWL